MQFAGRLRLSSGVSRTPDVSGNIPSLIPECIASSVVVGFREFHVNNFGRDIMRGLVCENRTLAMPALVAPGKSADTYCQKKKEKGTRC